MATLTNSSSQYPDRPEVDLSDELVLVLRQRLAAPCELVFDVLTSAEHLRHTIAPFGEHVDVCESDVRVGGTYHYVFTPDGGEACSFRGTYLEVNAPYRSAQTWIFDGWPDVEAIESIDLVRDGEATNLTYRLTFPDLVQRQHMRSGQGLIANFENVADYLTNLT